MKNIMKKLKLSLVTTSLLVGGTSLYAGTLSSPETGDKIMVTDCNLVPTGCYIGNYLFSSIQGDERVYNNGADKRLIITSNSCIFMGSSGNGAAVGCSTSGFGEQVSATFVPVTPPNEAPTITGVPTDIIIVEDSINNELDLSSIAVGDSDGDNLTITLTASAGVFNTPADGSTTGNGVTASKTSDTVITLAGSVDDITTYFDTTSNISYSSEANASGEDAATITISGTDGTDSFIFNPVANLDITAVNDSPVLVKNTGKNLAFSTEKTITNTMLNTTDIDDTATELTYTISTVPTLGTLKLNGTALAQNDTFTQDEIDNSLLTYTADDSTGSDSFDFSVADSGEDEVQPITGTFNIDVVTPTVSYTNTLKESLNNDGSIDGNITVNIIGAKLNVDLPVSNYISVSNLTGTLSSSFTKDSDTQITITLTGNAVSHTSANNITDLNISFSDDAFNNNTADNIIDSTKSDLTIEFIDNVISNLTPNRWNMISFADGYTVDTTKIDSSYITEDKDIKAFRNNEWALNPSDLGATEGIWIHPTGEKIGYVGTFNSTDQYGEGQLSYYKLLEVNKWHLVSVPNTIEWSELTKANITPSGCDGYTMIQYYDPITDSYNTTSNIPAGASIWVNHMCKGDE